MRPTAEVILIFAALVAFGGPLMLGLLGLRSRPGPKPQPKAQVGWNWRLTLASTLLYALAFNLVFFVQELFLVWPKALTPGLEPVLYHNNHNWTGSNPLARLFQGTGALAILITALAALWWLKRSRPDAPATLRLFAIWVAFSGLFQSLPQVVAGAVLPQNDVGMAMDYLGFSPAAMAVAVVAALIAMAVAGMGLARPFLTLASNPAQVSTRRGRMGFLFQVATLPAVLGVALILPYRVPGAIDQVVIVPVAATLIGIVWVQANGWRIEDVRLPTTKRTVAILWPIVLLIAVLLIFQLILRPGVAF